MFTEQLPSNDRVIYTQFRQVRSSKFLLGLASTVIVHSESRRTHDHILLSDSYGGPQTTGPVVHILKLTLHRPTLLLFFDTARLYRKRCVYQFFYRCVHSLPRNVFTEPLPSNDRGIHIQTHRLVGGIMKKAVDMGSGVIIYIPSVIKISLCIYKFTGRIQTHRE
jgi:hypothetical protein